MRDVWKHIGMTAVLLATTALPAQVARDSELYQTILKMDSTYFDAYNACDLKTQAALMDEDLEFYHDQGGLNTSREDIIQSIERNICGKVQRELIRESVEVHEIKGFGAVEIGLHKFYNNQEPDAPSKASRFITVWKSDSGNWKMHRIISLH
jgi:hypothetical protein